MYNNAWTHYEVNISNDEVELYGKIVFIKLLVIVIIDYKRYPSIYCLMQYRCFICSKYELRKHIIYLNIRITTFNNYDWLDFQVSYLFELFWLISFK